jgi:hypothetical protein
MNHNNYFLNPPFKNLLRLEHEGVFELIPYVYMGIWRKNYITMNSFHDPIFEVRSTLNIFTCKEWL